MTLPVPKFMKRREARRALKAMLARGERLVPADHALTLDSLREAAAILHEGGTQPREVPGFGPAWQLDAPRAAVEGLCRSGPFKEALERREYAVADLPWWGDSDPLRSYVLMRATEAP